MLGIIELELFVLLTIAVVVAFFRMLGIILLVLFIRLTVAVVVAFFRMLGIILLVLFIRLTVAVVVAFFVCWAPFHAQRLLTSYNTDWTPQMLDFQSSLFYISGKQITPDDSINSNNGNGK